MGNTPESLDPLLLEWRRIRFFSRIFHESRYLRLSELRFSGPEGAERVDLIRDGATLKTIALGRGTMKELITWALSYSIPHGPEQRYFGCPSALYSARLREAGDFVIDQVTHLSLRAVTTATPLAPEAAISLEAVLDDFPALIALLEKDEAQLQSSLKLCSALFGWVNAGILTTERAQIVNGAAGVLPVLTGVCASNVRDGLAVLSQAGFALTEGRVKGFLVRSGPLFSWHPAHAALAAGRERPAAAPRPPLAEKRPPEKATLLVVEDDPDQQKILELMLQAAGFDVLTASNGVDALETLRTHPVTAVITDLMMPILDGRQLIQSLRRDPKFADLPVLVLTVIDDEERELELLQIGANDYCVKTSQPKLFLERIHKLVARKR